MSPLFRSVVVEGLTKRDFRGIPESTEDWLKSIVTSPMPSQVTRMLPEGWGKNESDDKLWDDFINTIGLRERHYFTPVEKEIRNTYYERDPRGKLSENQKYKMKVRQAINKIATQNGNEPLTEENVKKMSDLINENVKNGKLTIYQGQDLLDNIGGEKKDVLVTMYNRLPEDDKETIYNKMSDKEKEVYPIPKGLYSPYNLLKSKNENVYDRLIEYGGVKTIHQDVKMSIFNKNVKLDKKASEEFNDDLIQKYGEQVKALIGTDKKRFDELKKTEMPVTKDNPEGNMLKEYLNLAWERAHLQAEQTAKIKYINKK
jgi:polyhydroxyalkanoate synthesis regulator phasin